MEGKKIENLKLFQLQLIARSAYAGSHIHKYRIYIDSLYSFRNCFSSFFLFEC